MSGGEAETLLAGDSAVAALLRVVSRGDDSSADALALILRALPEDRLLQVVSKAVMNAGEHTMLVPIARFTVPPTEPGSENGEADVASWWMASHELPDGVLYQLSRDWMRQELHRLFEAFQLEYTSIMPCGGGTLTVSYHNHTDSRAPASD